MQRKRTALVTYSFGSLAVKTEKARLEDNLKLKGIIRFRIRILEWEQFAEGSLETLWVLLMIVLLALTVKGEGAAEKTTPALL